MAKKYTRKVSINDLILEDLEKEWMEIAGFWNSGYRHIAEKKMKEFMNRVRALERGEIA